MTGDQAANGLYLLLTAVLVGSGLVARRLPIGRTLKMAGAWLAIFVAVAVTMSFQHEALDLIRSRLLDRAVVHDGTVRISMSNDRHFWVDARINGKTARLMVDSGATVTTLSRANADRMNVEVSSGFAALVQTANGSMAVQRARVRTIAIGGIEADDLAVHIAPPGNDINVLGMNFLTRLSGWTVERRWLILRA